MKKILWLTCAVVCVVTLASCVNIVKKKDGGKKITKNVKVQPFKRINLQTACEVHFVQADSVSVKIVGPENVIRHIKTTSDGTELTIQHTRNNGWKNLRSCDDVDIYLTSPDLISVLMRGAGDFNIDQHLDTDTLTIRLEGAGDVEIKDLICDEVNVEMKGAGDIELEQVIASKASFKLKGVGDVKAHLAKCDWAQCELEGVGDIELSGTVRHFRHKVRGTGSINTDDLQILSNH